MHSLLLHILMQTTIDKSRFREGNPFKETWNTNNFDFGLLFLILIFVVAAIVTIVVLWKVYLTRKRESMVPLLLFMDIADKHELSKKERKVLLKIADTFNLENPASVFVKPSYFTQYINNSAIAPNKEQHRFFQNLSAKLFGTATT